MRWVKVQSTHHSHGRCVTNRESCTAFAKVFHPVRRAAPQRRITIQSPRVFSLCRISPPSASWLVSACVEFSGFQDARMDTLELTHHSRSLDESSTPLGFIIYHLVSGKSAASLETHPRFARLGHDRIKTRSEPIVPPQKRSKQPQ